MSLTRLPAELLLEICDNLKDEADVQSLRYASRRCYHDISSPVLTLTTTVSCCYRENDEKTIPVQIWGMLGHNTGSTWDERRRVERQQAKFLRRLARDRYMNGTGRNHIYLRFCKRCRRLGGDFLGDEPSNRCTVCGFWDYSEEYRYEG